MLISDFAIRRPIITIVTMLALVVFGIFALRSLDTDEFPEVNPPVVMVSLLYPGASPESVERGTGGASATAVSTPGVTCICAEA